MSSFTRVALPVDGSAAAQRGIAFALELAKRERAAVDVCSVVDEIGILLPVADGAIADPTPMLEAATKANIDHAVGALQAAGIEAGGTLLHGNPVHEIDAFVRRRRADAIVLGTNGRSGVDRLFLGSVTMDLLRLADVPVVTVHADDTLAEGPMIVGVDASAGSLAALECAIERARVTGVSLRLVHVFEASRIEQGAVALGLRSRDALRKALTDAEDALDEAGDRVRSSGVSFSTELERGKAVDVLLTAIERHAGGGIAMGTHGRGALEGFVLGSVADGVIRGSRVPVYVVRRRTSSARKGKTSIHEQLPRTETMTATASRDL